MTTDSRQGLLVRGLVGGLIVGIAALSIVAMAILVLGIGLYLMGIGVGFALALVTSITGLADAYAPLWQFYLSNWLLVIPVLGVVALPYVYLRRVRSEIDEFKSALGASGLPADLNHEHLEGTVRRLATQANITEPELRIAPRDRPESYALGDDADGIIIVTEGLLDALDDAEIEAVLAHEVSHLANRDSKIMNRLLVPMLMAEHIGSDERPTLGGWLGATDQSETVMTASTDGSVGTTQAGGGTGLMPFVLFPINLAGWALLTAVTTIQFYACRVGVAYFSRSREFAADRAAAELTGSPGALASALEKLDGTRTRPTEDKREFLRSAAALDILPPEDQHELADYFWTHPPTEERIDRLRGIAGDTKAA